MEKQKKNTDTAKEKPTPTKKTEEKKTYFYVGVDVPECAVCGKYAVYGTMSDILTCFALLLAKYPYARELIVENSALAKANKAIREKSGSVYAAYKKLKEETGG